MNDNKTESFPSAIITEVDVEALNAEAAEMMDAEDQGEVPAVDLKPQIRTEIKSGSLRGLDPITGEPVYR